MVLSVVFVVLAVGVVAEARRRYRPGRSRVLWAVGGVVVAAGLNVVEPTAYGWISLPVAALLFGVVIVLGVGCLIAAARLGRTSAGRH